MRCVGSLQAVYIFSTLALGYISCYCQPYSEFLYPTSTYFGHSFSAYCCQRTASEIVKELGWQTMQDRRKIAQQGNFFRVIKGEKLENKVSLKDERPVGRLGHKWRVEVTGARTDRNIFLYFIQIVLRNIISTMSSFDETCILMFCCEWQWKFAWCYFVLNFLWFLFTVKLP